MHVFTAVTNLNRAEVKVLLDVLAVVVRYEAALLVPEIVGCALDENISLAGQDVDHVE